MAYDYKQFRYLITRVLQEFNLYSKAAVNLLLGTAAQESGFGTYLRQIGGGPALGAFQMEPATFSWLALRFKDEYPEFAERHARELEWDLRLAIIFARLKYKSIPEPLPEHWDIGGLAFYWKRFYNTYKGSGTEDHFIAAYNQYVKE